jgi:hypothetical protein
MIFSTPYEQYAEREGQHCVVVREINEPDEQHDAEVLPMYVICFDDGEEIEAWPEEVWPEREYFAEDSISS